MTVTRSGDKEESLMTVTRSGDTGGSGQSNFLTTHTPNANTAMATAAAANGAAFVGRPGGAVTATTLETGTEARSGPRRVCSTPEREVIR